MSELQYVISDAKEANPRTRLSASTLEALQEFMSEEQERKEKFAQLSEQAEKKFEEGTDEVEHGENVDIDMFQEDWQLSQFWYNDKTADKLVEEMLDGADENTVIGILSAPSVYAYLKKRPFWPTKHVYLFEYDDRFKILAGKYFVPYDYNKPTNLPEELHNKFDRVLVDPPFLQADCQTKTALSARWLLKKDQSEQTRHGEPQHKTVICTGERMKDLIAKLYPSTHITPFLPEHRNCLNNEFLCYATDDCRFLNSN